MLRMLPTILHLLTKRLVNVDCARSFTHMRVRPAQNRMNRNAECRRKVHGVIQGRTRHIDFLEKQESPCIHFYSQAHSGFRSGGLLYSLHSHYSNLVAFYFFNSRPHSLTRPKYTLLLMLLYMRDWLDFSTIQMPILLFSLQMILSLACI